MNQPNRWLQKTDTMNILLIETATSVCSVAIGIDGRVAAIREADEPNAHSSKMNLFIGELMEEAGLKPNQLTAICVSGGPGSYTGLRIGVSGAKGLCFGLKIPLLAVPTLKNMAAGYYQQHPDYEGMVCPMIDARRMECYTAVYTSSLEEMKPVSADIIEPGIYDCWLNIGQVVFIGDGAAKTEPLLGVHRNALFDAGFRISAAAMLPLAEKLLQEGRGEDVAYYEPFYLKDFVAKKSIVRGLR